jgi:hypothetical protein
MDQASDRPGRTAQRAMRPLRGGWARAIGQNLVANLLWALILWPGAGIASLRVLVPTTIFVHRLLGFG